MRNRLVKCLGLIKKFINSWREALNDSDAVDDIKFNIENYIDIYVRRLRGENVDQNAILKIVSNKHMGTYFFPQLIEFKEFQNQQARHFEKLSSISKLDSLGSVAVRPLEFQVKTDTPYLNLAIPILYKLNSYKPSLDNFFVPKHESRIKNLRIGAEDETTQLDSTSPDNTTENSSPQILDLNPSQELTEPPKFHPLHIFVILFCFVILNSNFIKIESGARSHFFSKTTSLFGYRLELSFEPTAKV